MEHPAAHGETAWIGAGRLRGPDSPAAPGRRRADAEFGQHGEGIGVPFGEPGQGEVFLRQPGQQSPALTDPAATQQRPVEPARPDRVGEGYQCGLISGGARAGTRPTAGRTCK